MLISHAPTAALRAARFPADEPLDDTGRRMTVAAVGTVPAARQVLCDGTARTRQTAEALGLVPGGERSVGDAAAGETADPGRGETVNPAAGETAVPAAGEAVNPAAGEAVNSAAGEAGARRPGPDGIRVDPALRDLDAGRWRGRHLAEIPAAELGRWLTDPAVAAPDGECVLDVLARVRTWLVRTRTAAESGRIVAVTHPAVVRAALVVAL